MVGVVADIAVGICNKGTLGWLGVAVFTPSQWAPFWPTVSDVPAGPCTSTVRVTNYRYLDYCYRLYLWVHLYNLCNNCGKVELLYQGCQGYQVTPHLSTWGLKVIYNRGLKETLCKYRRAPPTSTTCRTDIFPARFIYLFIWRFLL